MADDLLNELMQIYGDADPLSSNSGGFARQPVPHQDLVNALALPSTADVMGQYQPPPEPSWHDKYIKPWGSVALAKAEPNWFGKNVLSNIPESVATAANFLSPAARVPIPRVANPIKAYHGSPHDFDKFDLSKIGTGEGAQAYGHGLYFAEREGVAKSYRDALAQDSGLVGGNRYNDFDPSHLAARTIYEEGGIDNARKLFDRRIEELRSDPDQGFVQRMGRARSALQSDLPAYAPSAGKMYEVALHATPEQFLDWDKPLAGQSDAVRKAWASIAERHGDKINEGYPFPSLAENPNFKDPYGSTIYRQTPGHEASTASQTLNEAGIPGIKYLDQGSRGSGQGTSNYVVWTPEIIEILKKYGIAGPAALGAANALSEDKAPQQ